MLLAGVTFVVCLLPMAVWYLTHPERNAQIVSAYQLERAAVQWLDAVGSRLGLYWRFFDPAYLFVSGDASMINSTRTAGLFPMAFAVAAADRPDGDRARPAAHRLGHRCRLSRGARS